MLQCWRAVRGMVAGPSPATLDGLLNQSRRAGTLCLMEASTSRSSPASAGFGRAPGSADDGASSTGRGSSTEHAGVQQPPAMAGWHGLFRQASPLGLCGSSGSCSGSSRSSSGFSQQGLHWGRPAAPTALAGSLLHVRGCSTEQLSRRRVFKRECFNDTIMPNTTELLYGQYGIRALQGSRIAANTLEAVRRTLRRRIQKSARLWTRIRATVPVTQKALGVRMGKGKGLISYYCTPVRPGQIIFELDRVPRLVALQALQAVQHKFPVRLGFVEWS